MRTHQVGIWALGISLLEMPITSTPMDHITPTDSFPHRMASPNVHLVLPWSIVLAWSCNVSGVKVCHVVRCQMVRCRLQV